MNGNIVLRKNVHSHSRPMEHTVTLTDEGVWNCTCEHHKYRGAICKHIIEVQDELQDEEIAVVVETPQGIELVEVSEIPETELIGEIKGVADHDGKVVGGIIGLGIEVDKVIAISDEDVDGDVDEIEAPILIGLPTAKIPTTNKVERVNDEKLLTLLKLSLKIKEELLNLKETGVDVSECLDVVNDLILEI